MAALGVFAMWEASNYGYGTLRSMGPGLFPMALGVLLVVVGIGIVVEGMVAAGPPLNETANVRGVLAITASLAAFVVVLPRFGLMPAIFASVFLGGCAEREIKPVGLLLLAAGLAVLCYVVFIWGLQLRLRPFHW